ncbi:MAG: hypothetical protein RL748_3322 [Pseudomonadota bacterium]
MSNPYAASSANMDDIFEQTYDPPIFSVSGRIGRVRYISFSVVLHLASYLIAAILFSILAAMSRSMSDSPSLVIGAVVLLFWLPMIAITVILSIRRLNDLDQSGWLSLLNFVPLINLLFWLFLLVASGTKGSNRFGPEPCANSTLIIVVACIFPIGIFGIGILAAIALPAYQTYTKKAKFTEVVLATSPAKIAVEICAMDSAQQNPGATQIRGCGAGSNGVPADVTAVRGNVASVTTQDNGVITATAIQGAGLNGETYILVPAMNDGRVTWTVQGTCKNASPRIC